MARYNDRLSGMEFLNRALAKLEGASVAEHRVYRKPSEFDYRHFGSDRRLEVQPNLEGDIGNNLLRFLSSEERPIALSAEDLSLLEGRLAARAPADAKKAIEASHAAGMMREMEADWARLVADALAFKPNNPFKAKSGLGTDNLFSVKTELKAVNPNSLHFVVMPLPTKEEVMATGFLGYQRRDGPVFNVAKGDDFPLAVTVLRSESAAAKELLTAGLSEEQAKRAAATIVAAQKRLEDKLKAEGAFKSTDSWRAEFRVLKPQKPSGRARVEFGGFIRSRLV